MSLGVIFPGLKIVGILLITLTTLYSNPYSQSPPSTMQSTLLCSSSYISFTLVPLGLPDTFAPVSYTHL